MKFVSAALWNDIRQVARDRGPRCAAVPYLPSGAFSRLPLKRNDVLVVRFDDSTIRSGQTDPREVLRFLKAGVEVHQNSVLHAKVYVSARRAVVCSANLSATSESTLAEAGVVLEAKAQVDQARRFVLDMQGDSIGPEFARRKAKLYRPPRVMGKRKAAKFDHLRSIRVGQTPIWALGVEFVEFDEYDDLAARAANEKAHQKITDKDRYRLEDVWVDPFSLKYGDRVIQVIRDGRSRAVEAPARVLSVKAYRSKRGAKRMMIALEIRKHLRRRNLANVRRRVGASAEVLVRLKARRLIRDADLVYKLGQLWPRT